jgi:hypothetical protein
VVGEKDRAPRNLRAESSPFPQPPFLSKKFNLKTKIQKSTYLELALGKQIKRLSAKSLSCLLGIYNQIISA